MALLLVRHGHAGRRSAFKGDDRLRPLSKRGVSQAIALVPILAGYRPERILSSPYLRCCETVQPTAEALELPVETLEELAEGHAADVEQLIRRMVGESAVLSTHGDVAAAELESLVAGGGARPEQPRLQKGDVWVIGSSDSSPVILEHIRLSKRTPR
jgi:8-oxo-(d)GTP phosphatase